MSILEIISKNKILALNGGKKTRRKAFISRPYIGFREYIYLIQCLKNKALSRFVGSPIGDYRDYLKMTSESALKIDDFVSVLGGEYVRKFEAEFAKMHNVKYAVSSNSATSSLISALISVGIKKGYSNH